MELKHFFRIILRNDNSKKASNQIKPNLLKRLLPLQRSETTQTPNTTKCITPFHLNLQADRFFPAIIYNDHILHGMKPERSFLLFCSRQIEVVCHAFEHIQQILDSIYVIDYLIPQPIYRDIVIRNKHISIF